MKIAMYQSTYNLYPEIEPFNIGRLKVSDLHEVYYEECGSPEGAPVVFLHGGPGSGCNPTQRRFFDPQHYRIILLDQRGCGRSTPLGEVRENTTDDLVKDIEALRIHLGIARWHVFGGSWGSTLALVYAIKHTNHIVSLTLRGIFLSRPSELAWFLGGVQGFYPEVWHKLISYLPENERDDILTAYSKLIFSNDSHVNVPAAIQWNAFESSIMRLKPAEASTNSAPKTVEELQDEQAIQKEKNSEVARARVQIHYIQHQCFIDGDAILNAATKLNDIPTVIVQGRYDMVCPMQTAWILACRAPHAEFVIVPDAGHSAMELGITSALVAATEKFKEL
jgi:proline iminopeptidase